MNLDRKLEFSLSSPGGEGRGEEAPSSLSAVALNLRGNSWKIHGRRPRNLRRLLRSAAIFALLLPALLAITSCVSKAKADARARAAFLAGQQQANQMARQTQLRGPTVTVLGDVRISVVPWTADLTLAKAVISASYYGSSDPTEIVILREGQEIQCDPNKLLGGEDVQLQPHDVIELRH